MTKICSRCIKPKDVDTCFSRSAKHKGGYQPWCRTCTKAHQKTWYKKNKKKVAERFKAYQKDLASAGLCRQHCGALALIDKTLCQACAEKQTWGKIKHKYNITTEEWCRLLVNQGGVCALCREPGDVPGRGKSSETLVVDHDHKTGKIRGILHSRCNTGIGALRDDPRLLKAGALYLEATTAKRR